MKYCFFLTLIIISLAGCRDKDKLPAGVLPINRMKLTCVGYGNGRSNGYRKVSAR